MAQSRAEIDLTERAGNGRNYTHEERRERELRERRERERERARDRDVRGAPTSLREFNIAVQHATRVSMWCPVADSMADESIPR